MPGGVEGGVPGGVVGGVVGGLPEAPPPPPPPPSAPVRVGGNIKAPTKTKNVNPVYPPIAQSARVQGVVIIEATIGADGRVKDAKVLRSIPLLDQAALDAVKQWTVHADAAQRRARAGHHDGHGELHAAVTPGPAAGFTGFQAGRKPRRSSEKLNHSGDIQTGGVAQWI